MAIEKIYRGSDHAINITLNGSDGNPIDINSCVEIIISVYQRRESILEQFKLTETTVVVINATAGQIAVYLDRASILKVPEAKLYVEAVFDITNANYEDGYKRSIVSDMLIGEIKNSVL